MSLNKFSCVAFIVLALSNVKASEWWYSENIPDVYGPSQWGLVNPICNGLRQSPINIVTTNAVPAANPSPIRVDYDTKAPVTTTYKNDGHGYNARVSFANGRNPNITGGVLGSDVYTFANFHLHWPSEHTFDGKSFPAELHIVHFNLKYGNIENALSQPDGLAVVGVFFELKPSSSQPRSIFAATTNIREYGDAPYVETTPSFPLFCDQFNNFYKNLNVYSYLGGLTVPNCYEAVTWLVSKNTIPIYQSELDLLKLVKNEFGQEIIFNNRPVQNLNGRTVTKNF